MASNNPNRRSLDLFNVDQQAVENLDLTFQEAIPSSTSNVSYVSSRVSLFQHSPEKLTYWALLKYTEIPSVDKPL